MESLEHSADRIHHPGSTWWVETRQLIFLQFSVVTTGGNRNAASIRYAGEKMLKDQISTVLFCLRVVSWH